MLTELSVATALPVIQTPWQNQWQPELIGTLVFLVDNERVLLIEKRLGMGKAKSTGRVASGRPTNRCWSARAARPWKKRA